VVLKGENQEEFDLLRTSLIEEHQPKTVTELFRV